MTPPSNGPYAFDEYTRGSQPFCFDKDGKLVTNLVYPEIHDSVIILGHANIDAGTERPTKIGARCRIDHYVHVGHDCQLGQDVTVAAGAIICGHVTIEDNVYIGAGARIRQRLRIGKNAMIGLGAVVVKDVPPNVIVVGSPARFLRYRFPNDLETKLWRWNGSSWAP